MNILAIDDNVLALEELFSSIKEACPNDEIHSFSKPSELLDFAKENPCDIAFLEKVRECNIPHKTNDIAAYVTISIGGTTNVINHSQHGSRR